MKQRNLFSLYLARTAVMLSGARRVAMLLLLSLLTTATAWADPTGSFPTASGGSGTSGDPYKISSTTDLNQLATDVNSGTTYENTYFIVTANIAYNPNVLTIDGDGDSYADSNFTTIGGRTTDEYSKPFKGHFDGNGKTISGIRIYRNGDFNGFIDWYQGLFGIIDGGEVKNVILTDASITGDHYCGGIVGKNIGGTISNCKVTNTVCIGTINAQNISCHGGIAGLNDGGTISGCVSSVQLTTVNLFNIHDYGGITGDNNAGGNPGTLRDNLVIGAIIPEVTGGYYGAITGLSSNVSGKESCNYYINCTVAGTPNATNVGTWYANESKTYDADGARQALTVAIPTNGIPSGTATEYNVSGITGYTGKSGGSSTTENNIILYDNGTTSTYYSGAGETVTFLYNYDGYQVSVTDADGKVDFTKDIIQTSETNIYHNHTFTMPAKAVTITATDVWGVAGGKDGSTADKAYTITSTAGLDLLAQNVNAGREYINMYFKLGADITYTHTTDWNDATSTENNFTPIGVGSNSGKNFGGFFDGCNYTISGIRIHSDDGYQGIFAWPQSSTAKEIKNIKLADARIKGKGDVGGIVGKFDRTIINCHIASTVAIIATNYNCGGIAGYDGYSGSSIIGCTCAATVSGNNYVGGIAGGIVGSITDCFVTGATVSGTSNVGAIVGFKNTDGTLKNNYYTNSTVTIGGTAATDAGCNGADVAGARKAYTVTLGTYVSMDGTATAHGTVTNDGDISITSYANNSGIMYTTKSGGTTTSTIYAGATETIKLKYTGTVAEGCVVGYKVNDGEATAGNTITMPAADATITEVDMALWGNGDGSETNPYVITTTEGLDLLAQKVNAGTSYEGKYFKLGADIEYNKNTANNYTPIGDDNNYFYGSFDGNGKTISGINIYNPDATYQGVFGYLKGTVKNLVVSNCSIVAWRIIGVIAGQFLNGTIENCIVSNNVTLSGSGGGYVGGIVGSSSNGTIKGCVSAAAITGTISYHSGPSGIDANHLGGIAGAALTSSDSKVTDNLFTGTIDGDLKEYIGAIVGESANGTLTNNVYTSAGIGGIGAASSKTGADGAGAHKAVEISAAEGVTITPTGTKTTYNVSGITVYADNKGLLYNNGTTKTLYAGDTDDVKLSIAYTASSGYEFDKIDAGEGVTVTASGDDYIVTMPTSNVTVDVVYKAISYTITYDLAEGTVATANPTTYTVESDAITLNNPTREGYTFAGWTGTGLTEATITVTIAKGSTGDREYTATWKKDPDPDPETDSRYEVDGDGVAVTTMAYLAELALDDTMEDYVKDGKLKATVTPKNKYWTLACGVDLLLPEGVVVYKARMNSAGTKVELTEIDATTLGGVLKANNGVLMASTPGESYEFVVSPNNSVTTLSTADAKSYGNDNELVPVLEETHFDTEDYFILTENKFMMVDISKDTKVPAGKAVLKVPAGSAKSRTIDIDGDGTTGIHAGVMNAEEEIWYNLQGQRISKPTRKGIYIVNGKKVKK